MKTDVYTKIVLTVIAVALIGIFIQNASLTSTAHAQSGTQTVRLEGQRKYDTDAINVRLIGISEGRVEDWEAIKTKSNASSGPIDVNIDKVGGIPTYGVVPVHAQ